jgi:hypothetical protein
MLGSKGYDTYIKPKISYYKNGVEDTKLIRK